MTCAHCAGRLGPLGGSEYMCLGCGLHQSPVRPSVLRQREQRRLWGEAGLCRLCGEPPAEGRAMCERHLRYFRGRRRKPERVEGPPAEDAGRAAGGVGGQDARGVVA